MPTYHHSLGTTVMQEMEKRSGSSYARNGKKDLALGYAPYLCKECMQEMGNKMWLLDKPLIFVRNLCKKWEKRSGSWISPISL